MADQPALNKGYKSILFEYCQKKKIGPPSFDTVTGERGYYSEVIIEGTRFGCGDAFAKKKQAENDAARVSLIALGLLVEPKEEDITEEDKEEDIAEEVKEELESTEQAASEDLGQHTSSPSLVGTLHNVPFGHSPLGLSPVASVVTSKNAKSILHEYCQKSKMSLPQYDTEESYHGNRLCGYTCVLTLNDDVTYVTESIFPNKHDAEHSVAAKALVSFSPGSNNSRSPFYTGSQRSFSSPISGSSPRPSNPGMMFKNLLQEHLRQRNLDNPTYDTNMEGW